MSETSSGKVAVGLLVGDTLRFTEAELALTASEDGLHFRARFDDEELGADATFEVSEGPGGAQGRLSSAEHDADLFDDLQLVQRTFPAEDGEFSLLGLQGDFSFPLSGRFRRLRTVFLGLQDEGMVEALVGAWASDEHEQVAHLPWTLASLTRFAAAHARKLPHVDDVQVGVDGQLTLTIGEGTHHVGLHNLLTTVQNAPEAAMQRIADFFEATRPPEGPVADGDVMFRVMRATSPVKLEAQIGDETHEIELASIGVAEDLSAVFVRDMAHNMAYLQQADVDGLSVAGDKLFELAADNLLRSLPVIHIRGEAPLFMLIAGGDYECSLALMPDFWDAMTPLVDGQPLVAMPARDLCFIIGDDPEVAAQLRGHIDNLGELAYPISPTIYRVHDQGRRLEPVG